MQSTGKNIIITRSKIQGGISRVLKTEALKLIAEQVKKTPLENLFDSTLNYSLQKTLKDSLKKLTPIQTIEINYLFRK